MCGTMSREECETERESRWVISIRRHPSHYIFTFPPLHLVSQGQFISSAFLSLFLSTGCSPLKISRIIKSIFAGEQEAVSPKRENDLPVAARYMLAGNSLTGLVGGFGTRMQITFMLLQLTHMAEEERLKKTRRTTKHFVQSNKQGRPKR